MKPYHILKSFNGSQNGIDSHSFEAGTVCTLSDSLAAAVSGTGWIKLVTEAPPIPKATDRETKVVAPEETKVEAPEEVKAEEPTVSLTEEVKPKKVFGGKKKA